LIARNISC